MFLTSVRVRMFTISSFGEQTLDSPNVRVRFADEQKRLCSVRVRLGPQKVLDCSGVSPTLLWMPDVLVAAVSATQDKNCGQRTILLPTIDEERERFPKLKTLQ